VGHDPDTFDKPHPRKKVPGKRGLRKKLKISSVKAKASILRTMPWEGESRVRRFDSKPKQNQYGVGRVV